MAEKEQRIKIVVDSDQAQSNLKKVSGSFTELNSVTELASKAFNLFGSAAGQVSELLSRGDAYGAALNAFKNINQLSDEAARGGLTKLREAAGGVITEFELLKSSNLASSLNISQEAFQQLAASADALGDAVGGDATQALNQLVTAMGKGNDRSLISLGINVDLEKAYKKTAAAKGIETAALSENTKKLIAQEEILKAVKEKTKNLGEAQTSAGESLEKVKKSFTNLFDKVGEGLSKNDKLAKSFDDLATNINNLDVSELVSGLAQILTIANSLIGILPSLGKRIDQIATGGSILAGALGVKNQTYEDFKTYGMVSNASSQLKQIDQPFEKMYYGVTSLFGGEDREQARARLTRERATGLARMAEKEQKEIDAERLSAAEGLAAIAAKYESTTKSSTKEEIAAAAAADRKATAARKAAEAASKELEKAQELRKEFEILQRSTAQDYKLKGLEESLDAAISKADKLSFDNLLGDFKQERFTQIYDDLATKYGKSVEDNLIKAEASAQVEREVIEKAEMLGENVEQNLKDAYQNSTDFFTDIFTASFEGSADSIFETLADGLRKVAIGAASDLATQLSQSLLGDSFGDIFGSGGAGVSSGGGLGKIISQGITSALGLGGGGAGFGPLASGDAYGALLGGGGAGGGGLLGGLLGGGGAAAGGGLSLAGILPSLGAIGGGFLLSNGLSGLGKSIKGDKTSTSEDVALAAQTFGFSALGKLFGSGGNPDRLAREDALSKLLKDGNTFQGLRGTNTIDGGKYNVDFSNKQSGQTAGLLSSVGLALGGGEDKLGSDLAGIFTNALGDAKNFNEAIIETSSLLGKLGVDAPQLKDELKNLFLDGKVSLDEFTAGVSNLNIIAQEDLVGENSVADALRLLGDETVNNRGKLKGLELSFKEMAQNGIDSSGEINAYLTEKFGPEVASVFQQLSSSGIDSFEDIKNASADQIALIFNIISPLGDAIRDAVGQASKDAARDATAAFNQIGNAIKGTVQQATQATAQINNVGKAAKNTNAAVIDPNPALHKGY